MAVYTNNLKLKEIADGAESGSWGASTNTNLDLIAQAFGYASYNGFSSDANATVTVQNSGATEEFTRSMYVKITSSATLSTTRTLTIAPNNISRVLFIENATTGSQTINISQGSGANVAIPTGKRKCIYLDGAGSGAAVVEVFDSFEVKDSFQISGATPTLTIGDGGEEDTKVVFDGNAGDFHVGLDDSSDNLVLGAGTTLGAEPRVEIDKDGGVQIISDAPTNGQLKLSDIGANADQAVLRHDSGVLSIISTQASDTVGSIQIQGQSTSGTFTYITFASTGTTTDKDIEITTSSASKSIILRSPDGSRFRITVDNSGNLSTSSV